MAPLPITVSPGDLIVKDPGATKKYQFNWTDYLTNLGSDLIAQSSFAISGPDSSLSYSSQSVVSGNQKTQLFLSAGTAGGLYTVTNRIVTDQNPATTDERSFYVLVQDQ